MKVRIMLAALAVAAGAVAAFGAGSAKAVVPPVSVWIQQCQTDGGVNYITDGNWEDEDDCEASDAALADPGEFGLTVTNVCIEGTTYLYADDEGLPTEFLAFLNDEGYSAKLGACASAAAPPSPPGIFLCYSKYQDTPGVWPQDVAAQLLKQGYWLPYAVPGDAADGTNLGGYHLTCNIAATQSVSDSFVGSDGTVLGPSYAGATIGLYPKVGG